MINGELDDLKISMFIYFLLGIYHLFATFVYDPQNHVITRVLYLLRMLCEPSIY